MVDYRFEIEKIEDSFLWTVSIYADSELIKQTPGCYSQLEAENYGMAFIEGIKFVISE